MGDGSKVAVVGSYVVGYTMKTARAPERGETVEGSDFAELHGGKGSNQAVQCARLGTSVSLVASIAADPAGDRAMELYRTEGIDTSGVTRNQLMSSGAAFIIVEESGENLISVDSGSNRALLPTDVENQKQLLSNSRVVLTQMEIPAETAMAAMRVGRESGTTTILNPAPYQHIEDGWENVDIVTPNETEARLITGKPPNQPAEPALLARSIMDKGVGSVVLTLGAAGAFVMSPSFTGLVPGRKVSAIDTTGAGDAFAGALATATAEGRDLESAVKFAVVAASLAVTKYGVIASLPFRNDVDQATSGVL